MSLISRQAAIDALISEGRSVDSRYISAERIIHEEDAIEVISMLPSAEPEIIRCKDCKWCVENYDTDGNPYWICKNWDGGTDADGFCYEAERKVEMPSAEKTGRWIKENIVFTSDPPQYVWHCSECSTSVYGFSSGILTPYCPYCGAKMEVEK